MVLVGLMELQLIGGDGRPLPEVLAPDGGASYVVAAPGQPFKVRFTVHGNLQPMPGCFHNVSRLCMALQR